MFRKLLLAIRRFFARRAARKLLAQPLPRGLPAPAKPFQPELFEPPPGEFWTLPLYRKPARKLFRLAALPPLPKKLDVVRVPAARAFELHLKLPDLLEIPEPLPSAVVDLGAARPARFRLDADLRLPVEVDPVQLPADRPPAKERRVRPRTPLPRAPVNFRFRPRHFRLDPQTLHPANEAILPLEPRDTTGRWIPPAFRARFLDLPWMARERIMFLGPLQYEWFLMWWDQFQKYKPGGAEPRDYDLADELAWAMEECKEQMLIRRDVKKDENPPEPEQFFFVEVGHPIEALEPAPPVPKPEWHAWEMRLPEVTVPRLSKDAYLEWRTLMDALEER